MKNRVKRSFIDKETKERYNAGDIYKHENEDRVAFLVDKGFLQDKNLQTVGEENTDISSESNDLEFEGIKHTGGGWYKLPNGGKVQGKKEAEEALAELKAGE